jgi:glutamate-ammonia-ligase adenylyltransferase
VATALSAFRDYQRHEAWTWEHLALTRARPVAGDGALGLEVEAFRRSLLAEKSASARIRADVAEMRARLAAARPQDGAWDAKFGRGRLMEADLAAQTAALLAGSAARDGAGQVAAGVAAGLLAPAESAALEAALGIFWAVHAAARLLTGGVLRPDTLGAGGRRFLLRETGQPDAAALSAAMARAAAGAAAAFDRLLTEGGRADAG